MGGGCCHPGGGGYADPGGTWPGGSWPAAPGGGNSVPDTASPSEIPRQRERSHPVRAICRSLRIERLLCLSPDFDMVAQSVASLRSEPTLLNLPAQLVRVRRLTRSRAVNLAWARGSAKIVRLLRRVAGVRKSLAIESRLRRVPMVLRGRTAPGDPIRPTYPSGRPLHNDKQSAVRCGPGVCDTPDRGGRRAGRAARAGQPHPRRSRESTTGTHTKDERDLWRDRRSASGSRPMTTR